MLFEQKLDNSHFILSGGAWRQVEGNFYQSVTDFVANQVREDVCEPLYAGISIADQTARKNREAVFNTPACVLRPQSIRFDQAKLRIGSSRQDKEFCDILDLTDDGTTLASGRLRKLLTSKTRTGSVCSRSTSQP